MLRRPFHADAIRRRAHLNGTFLRRPLDINPALAQPLDDMRWSAHRSPRVDALGEPLREGGACPGDAPRVVRAHLRDHRLGLVISLEVVGHEVVVHVPRLVFARLGLRLLVERPPVHSNRRRRQARRRRGGGALQLLRLAPSSPLLGLALRAILPFHPVPHFPRAARAAASAPALSARRSHPQHVGRTLPEPLPRRPVHCLRRTRLGPCRRARRARRALLPALPPSCGPAAILRRLACQPDGVSVRGAGRCGRLPDDLLPDAPRHLPRRPRRRLRPLPFPFGRRLRWHPLVRVTRARHAAARVAAGTDARERRKWPRPAVGPDRRLALERPSHTRACASSQGCALREGHFLPLTEQRAPRVVELPERDTCRCGVAVLHLLLRRRR